MDTFPTVGSRHDKNRRRIGRFRKRQPNALLAALEALCPYPGGKMHMSFPPTHALKLLLSLKGERGAPDYPTAH